MSAYHKLSREEDRIITHKGTEAPFSGEYEDCFDEGVYLCRRCDLPLYLSKDKFHSSCGWPSFDDEIEGAIVKTIDQDGHRVEIQCSRCQAHLGHIFKGEGFTKKNTRHCVNSLSLRFISAFTEEEYEKVYLGGGCFWGVEFFLKEHPGVIKTSVGFMGGKTVSPSYEEVCYGNSEHIEVVEVLIDNQKISYEDIIRYFFEIHDPTQSNGQGPDIGHQYLSVIFFMTNKQKQKSLNVIDVLEKKGFDMATLVRPASLFYKASEYHQNYYAKTGHQPYCHRLTKRFT